jgi:hypothetical protein
MFWYASSMKLTTNPLSFIVSVAVGCALGYIGGPAAALVPWALVGFLIGVSSGSKKAAMLNGAAYGFALAYVFMLAGYNGSGPVSTKLVLFILFGIVGALCGIALSLIGLLTAHPRQAK